MATVPPFHSKKQKDVYHTCTKCTEGNNIEPQYKVAGTGGLPKCQRCTELTAKAQC